MIERLDAEIPKIRALNPDVLIVTGDHSTPSKLRSHSWHPVPTLLWAKTCRTDAVTEFGETQCLRGGLGQFQAMYLLPLAMAHAGGSASTGPEMPRFLDALRSGQVLLMDGAMGTELQRAG